MRSCRIAVSVFLCLAGLLAVASGVSSQTVSATRLTRFPYIQRPTTSSITLIWETATPASCAIRYGLTPEMPDEKRLAGQEKHHAAELMGLKANSAYHYRVFADGAPIMPPGIFKTNKDESHADFSFAVLGDSGTGAEAQKSVAAQMLRAEPDFIIHTGDVIYPAGAAKDYDKKFFLPYKDLLSSVCIYPTMGNHDYRANAGRPYLDVFMLPANNPAKSERYYSFDYANAHFVCIDSVLPIGGIKEQEQFRWLKKDLASTHKPWKFVFAHYPPYSNSRHGSDMELRKRYSPLFEKYSVDMMFSGHDHNYQRTVPTNTSSPDNKGVIYVVTGGGGAGLYEVGRNEWTAFAQKTHHFVSVYIERDFLKLQAISHEGEVFDELTLEKGTDNSDDH